MANQKKKLSLKEFYEDSTLGDSWADDDIDLSSISVPVIQQRHNHHDYLNYQSNSHQTFSSSNHAGIHSGYPKAPPYIAKFTNIPSHFGVNDIEDLFRSRFMKFLKMKVFWEIHHDLLPSSSDPAVLVNKRKKVAFVELHTVQDFEKVLKWNDLFLGGGLGKVLVNVGNFGDFKTYNDLNQKVSESDDPALPSYPKRDTPRRRSIHEENMSLHPNDLKNYRQPPQPPNSRFYHKSPEGTHSSLHSHQVPTHVPPPSSQSHPPQHTNLPPLEEPKPFQPPVRKSNPFGSAKPVDTLARQLEIEKKLQELEINKTTYRTLGHADEKSEQSKQNEQTELNKIDENSTEESTTIQQQQQQEQPTKTSKDSTTTPPVRSKQSTPSHHHLKLSQPNSPKKSELRPALKPEVEAWKPLNSSSVRDNTNVRSPPKQPVQLHPQQDQETEQEAVQEPRKVSADFFKSKKKPSQQQDLTDDISKRKVLLKRKEADNAKKNGEARHIVRRNSSVEKEEVKLQEEEKKDEGKETKEATKPKSRRSSKTQNDSTSSNSESEKIETSPSNQRRLSAKASEEIPRPESTVDRFGRKVFHNATYVKNSNKQVESNDAIDTNEVEKLKENTPREITTTTESTEKLPEGQENINITTFRGRGRGRGRGPRGSRGGRGRGRGGASFGPRRDGSEEAGSSSRSRSPIKKSSEATTTTQDAKPKQSTEANSIEPKDKHTIENETKPQSQSSYRGRGGFRGYRRGRGKNGLFHNVSRTFNNSSDKEAKDAKSAISTTEK